MSRNGSPAFTSLDVGHSRLVYAEVCGNVLSCHTFVEKSFDFPDIIDVNLSPGSDSFGRKKASAFFFSDNPSLRSAGNVVTNGGWSYAMPLGDFIPRCASDIFREYASPDVVRYDLIAAPKFIGAVPHIVASGSAAKVVGVDAGWVVTRVKDVLASINRAIMKLVAKPVGEFFTSKPKTSATKHAVSSVVFAGIPLPASVVEVLVNLAPKSIVKHMLLRCGHRGVLAG